MRLDHAIIAVPNLDQAIEDYTKEGFTVLRGGVHANGATHNALICFKDGTYLELLALTGNPPIPGLIDFSLLLHNREGNVGYALRSENLEADAELLSGKGIKVGAIMPGERKRADGTLVQWRLMLIEDGFMPFLIQDVTPHELRVPNDATHANGIAALHYLFFDPSDKMATQFATLCEGIKLRPDTPLPFRIAFHDPSLHVPYSKTIYKSK